MTMLQTLLLSNNDFSGPIPIELSLLTKLVILRLNENAFTGPIPTQLQSLTDIQELNLDQNALSGVPPAVLGQLTTLTQLQLGSNQFTGTFPSFIALLTNLVRLNMNSNQFTGEIPSFVDQLTSLRYLYIQANQLSGTIPTAIGMATALTHFYANNNGLEGAIPNEVEQLTNLVALNVGGNQHTGAEPGICAIKDNLAPPAGYCLLAQNPWTDATKCPACLNTGPCPPPINCTGSNFPTTAPTAGPTQLFDCFVTTGIELKYCMRWRACAASGGTLCDDGLGTLGTTLCVAPAPQRPGAALYAPLTRAPPSLSLTQLLIVPPRSHMTGKGIIGPIPAADVVEMTGLVQLYATAALQ